MSKRLSTNSIGKKITTLKTILNAATDRGVNTNTAFKSRRFTATREESDSIYLNDTDLDQLYKLDLTENTRLERVRDLFLLGAYTGLRFSDFTRLTADNITGDMITMHQSKTGAKVTIPLHPITNTILQRYNGHAPKALSNQKMNEYLKELGKAANISEQVSKTITKGGKQITKNFQKWELISTHTARRSFATNLYKSGFPAQSIMQITGHKTERAFLKYIKATKEEHAKMLSLHWAQNSQLKAVK